MSYGATADARRQAAKKHARRRHECPRCGRVVYGNGYANHKRACKQLAWKRDHQYEEPTWGGE